MSANYKFWSARKAKDMTQGDLASQADITQRQVSQIENEGWIPPPDIRDRLALALGVAAGEIFKEAGK